MAEDVLEGMELLCGDRASLQLMNKPPAPLVADTSGETNVSQQAEHGWGFWEQPEDTHTSTSQQTEGSPALRSSLNPQGYSVPSMSSQRQFHSLTGFLLYIPSFSGCQSPSESCTSSRRDPGGWSCWGRNRLSVSALAAVRGWILPFAMSDPRSLGRAGCPGCPQPTNAGMGVILDATGREWCLPGAPTAVTQS